MVKLLLQLERYHISQLQIVDKKRDRVSFPSAAVSVISTELSSSFRHFGQNINTPLHA